MASGYTVEVIKGNVTTLEQFAEVCLKGFGATAHMKDEPLVTPYRKAIVDKEHKKTIKKLNKSLIEFNKLSDQQLIDDETAALNKSRDHFVEKIELAKQAKKDLSALLLDAQLWTPPTDKYIVMKEFMIKNLKETIGFDCDLTPINKLIEDIDGRLATIDPELIRSKHIEGLNQQIDYHQEAYDVDHSHCKQSNEWVKELMDSFK